MSALVPMGKAMLKSSCGRTADDVLDALEKWFDSVQAKASAHLGRHIVALKLWDFIAEQREGGAAENGEPGIRYNACDTLDSAISGPPHCRKKYIQHFIDNMGDLIDARIEAAKGKDSHTERILEALHDRCERVDVGGGKHELVSPEAADVIRKRAVEEYRREFESVKQAF